MDKRRVVSLAVLALAVLAGGVAFAAIPDSGGEFHACVKERGDLYLIDHDAGQRCRESGKNPEKHVHFNQAGQPGPQGLQGEPGAQGPAGPAGGVEGWYLEESSTIAKLGTGPLMEVDSLTLPAGTYFISGVVRLINFAAEQVTVRCNLTKNVDQVLTEGTAGLTTMHGGRSDAVTPLQGVATLTEQARISISCVVNGFVPPSGEVWATDPQLQAVAVGTVHARTG